LGKATNDVAALAAVSFAEMEVIRDQF